MKIILVFVGIVLIIASIGWASLEDKLLFAGLMTNAGALLMIFGARK